MKKLVIEWNNGLFNEAGCDSIFNDKSQGPVEE